MERDFKVVCKIKHNNNYYLILQGDSLFKCFLKYTNDGYEYPTYKEFKELHKIYGMINSKELFLNINPKVVFKEKLIPMSLAISMMLSMTGCGRNQIVRNYEDMGIYLDDGYFKNDGIYQIVKLTGGEHPYEKIVTPGSFEVDKDNITYEDVINEIKNNSNINPIYQKYLIEAVKSIELSGLDTDLSSLYFNIKTFKGFNFNAKFDNDLTVATFDQFTHMVNVGNVDSEDFEKTLVHEMIGHGMTHAYDEEKDILCTTDYGYYALDTDGKLVGTGSLGKSLNEGVAENIKALAFNTPVKDSDSPYMIEAFMVRLLCNVAGITLGDYIKNGTDYLTIKLKEKGVQRPIELIGYFDTIRTALNNNELTGLNTNLEEVLFDGLIKDIIDKGIKDGYSREGLIVYVSTLLDNAESYVEPTVVEDRKFYGDTTFDGAVFIDLSKLQELYIEYIDNLETTRK